jgi:hypothetical protein
MTTPPETALLPSGLADSSHRRSRLRSRWISHARKYTKFTDGIDSTLLYARFSYPAAGLLQVPKVTKIPIQPDVMDLRVPGDWSKTDKGAMDYSSRV